MCAVNKALMSFDLLPCRPCGELWGSFKEGNKLILHSSINSVICCRHYGLTRGSSLFGDHVKGAMHHWLGFEAVRWPPGTTRPHAPMQTSVGCAWNTPATDKLFQGHFNVLAIFHNCRSAVAIRVGRLVPFHNRYVLLWGLRGRDAICSVHKMEVLHYVVNVQVTACTVFWGCWLTCLISKQQVLMVKGRRPTRMNIATESIDAFFQMFNFLFEEHPTKKKVKIFYCNIIFKVNNKITTYASACFCICY